MSFPQGAIAIRVYKAIFVCAACVIYFTLWLAIAPSAYADEAEPLIPAWSSEEYGGTVALGDYDNDGDLDLAVGGRQFARVYRNDGGALTTAAVWTSALVSGTWPSDVAWGDYDNDGYLDLVVGSRPTRIYHNEGVAGAASSVPVFTIAWESDGTDNVRSAAWGDYDADSYLDLAIGSFGSGQYLRLYHNNRRSHLHIPLMEERWNDATSVVSLAWGDYDRDGNLDLATSPGYGAFIYHNENVVLGGRPSFHRYDLTLWNARYDDNISGIYWGDIDRNGHLELIITSLYDSTYRSGGISVLSYSTYPDGSPYFGEIWSSVILEDCIQSIAIGDYDGDGDDDLFAGSANVGGDCISGVYQPNRLYRNDGVNSSGNLTLTLAYTLGGPGTSGLAWGDVDSDGYLDLVIGRDGQLTALYKNTTALDMEFGLKETDGSFTGIALADFDEDGDLDIAAGSDGNWYGYGLLLRNDGFTDTGDLAFTPLNPPHELAQNYSSRVVAWGDYNGDGHLDLVVGGSSRDASSWDRPRLTLFRNIPATSSKAMTFTLAWQSAYTDSTTAMAWGDYDSDGDLDLAVGNYGQPNRLYRFDVVRDSGTPTVTLVWSATAVYSTTSIAWGDVDGDGDLDLAVGNNRQRSVMYRNDCTVASGPPIFTPVWSSLEPGNTSSYEGGTTSVAWGDVDGDGDLDLAVGGYIEPVQMYHNYNGVLSAAPVWSSAELATANTVGWGDYDADGDLDLAVGNGAFPGRGFDINNQIWVFRNDDGVLTRNPAWSSEVLLSGVSGPLSGFNYQGLSWGDIEGDGDLDLAAAAATSYRAGNGLLVYLNKAVQLPSSRSVGQPTMHMLGPRPTASADFYSSSTVWSSGQVPITYTLFETNSIPARQVIGLYSPNGGGQWLPAIPTPDTITRNLATSRYPAVTMANTHVYTWDVWRSGFMGQSDNVVFRLAVAPTLTLGHLPGPYMYGSFSEATFPFRVRGTQVRVVTGTVPATGSATPVVGAMVYRLASGNTNGAEVYASSTGQPFVTDGQGYLQGRGELRQGDGLVALLPVSSTGEYTLYHASATPVATGLALYKASAGGVQTLTVSARNPLLLFNLDVSLEWDARNDAQFLSLLEHDLDKASDLLYDWTNGQVALGRVRVFHDREMWLDAHVRIYATNRLRPNAAQGGIIASGILTETSLASSVPITYEPGQVRMGAVWNRYGEPTGKLGEDWPRTLAHELGHYLLFLDDDYLGLDPNNLLIPVDTCKGTAMADPYRDDYSEFHPSIDWTQTCSNTLPARETGRWDWATIDKFYPALNVPITQPNSGPTILPLNVTQVITVEPKSPANTLEVPSFFVTGASGAQAYLSANASAYVFQGDWLLDLGTPTLSQVTARGVRPDDRLCVYDLTPQRQQLGCETVSASDTEITVRQRPGWLPDVTVTPVTSKTIAITVTNVTTAPSELPGLRLYARLYPVDITASVTIPLTYVPAIAGYTGVFSLAEPVPEGYIHVWVDEGETTQPRREVVTAYSIGGNPGHMRSRIGHMRSRIGHMRSRISPVLSSDGQVIVFGQDLNFDPGEFYALQPVTRLPAALPWATQVGRAYRLTASPTAPSMQNASVSFGYLGGDVPPGEEDWLRVYLWNGQRWQVLTTTLDLDHNFASAPAQGPGVYALMSSIELRLRGPGWDQFSYPVLASSPVTDALLSLSRAYTLIYGYERDDSKGDPWKVHANDPAVPAWVNDLHALDYGKVYWINLTQPITLYLKGGFERETSAPMASESWPALPPATYYGVVQASPSFVPAPGMEVTAWVGSKQCGRSRTLRVGQQVVYTVNVLSDGPGDAAGCGEPGRAVAFKVGARSMATTAVWNNDRLLQVRLAVNQQFLPSVIRR